VLSNGGSAYSKAIEKLARLLVPAEPKSTAHKRGFSVVGRSGHQKPVLARQSSGLLGALRGKRAS
jgi:hypothetical protein